MSNYQVMPNLTDDEYAELKADIKARGVMVPIEFDEQGNPLDGHHRLKICEELGITDYPKVIRAGMTEEEKRTHARKLNMARRQLSQEQRRDLIREQLRETPEKSDRQIAASLGVSDKTVGSQRKELESGAEIPHLTTSIGADGKEYTKPTRHKTVTVFNPSPAEEKAIKQPEIIERMAQSGKTAVEVKREIKAEEQEERRRENAEKIKALSTPLEAQGLFQTIVIDPPWDHGDEGDINQFGRTKPEYATMPIDEIAQLPIDKISDDNCHLYLWVTNRSLPKAFSLIEKWGFRYITCLTWVKPSFGIGNYFRGSTEQVLFAVKGSQPLKRKDACTHFCADRGKGHSAKPDEFYKLVESCSYTDWTRAGVTTLMRNERYCGDVLARKTYTPNFKDHKSKKNKGKKNKYFQPDHHDAIVTRAIWNAAQRILNSRRFNHEGEYLPMQVIDHGILTGFISMNRSWAGFEADNYFRIAQIAMGILEDEIESDLENEYIPDAGHRLGGMIDDHGISRIARELTEAEQQIKDELEGKDQAEQELREQAEIVKTFQVVSGDMFSKANEPILTVKPGMIHFNQACRKKLDAEYVEILFNPVERMIVIRVCDKTNPNALLWDGKAKGARALCRILYDSLGWDLEYNYSVPCQEMPVMLSDNTVRKVLVFDLDNYIGKAIKKDEIIIPKKQPEESPDRTDDSKSFYFPPDAGDEPQELVEIAEQVQRELELNKRIFGTPAFKHSSAFRNIDGEYSGEEWFIPARPTDIDHKISDEVIDSLMTAIEQNPPKPPTDRLGNEQTVIDVSGNDTGVN